MVAVINDPLYTRLKPFVANKLRQMNADTFLVGYTRRKRTQKNRFLTSEFFYIQDGIWKWHRFDAETWRGGRGGEDNPLKLKN